MFACCLNNPVCRLDALGRDDKEATPDPYSKLEELLDKYAAVEEWGFTIDIESETKEWDACIKEIGVQDAYDYMSTYLCNKYKDTYGEEFLFSNDCVSYEIEYHVDAYMCIKNYPGYSRHVSTYVFSKDELDVRCKQVDISTKDVFNLKQMVMFDYKSGIRSCYWYTEKDPYRRAVTAWGMTYYER